MRIGRLLGLGLTLAAVLAGVAAGQQQLQRQAFARAIRSRNWPAVRVWLGRGSDPNMVSSNGTTPLMVAAEAGDLQYLRKLLGSGAKVNAINSHWSSAVDWAAQSGQSAAVKLLLNRGAAVSLDSYGIDKGPRHYAFSGGHKALHRELVRRERLTRQMLDLCADAKVPSPIGRRLRQLLDQGAIVNGYDVNSTALRWAARRNDLEAAKLLLERGADPNFQALLLVVPLEEAVAGQRLAMTRLLLACGADPNLAGLGPPPLFNAASLGNAVLTRELMAAGANVNSRLGSGETPLTFAKERNHLEIVRILQAAGAR